MRRYNRQPYMMMQWEPKRGANTMAAFSHLWTEAQKQIQVPEGYKMTYFGEQSEQDKGKSETENTIPEVSKATEEPEITNISLSDDEPEE